MVTVVCFLSIGFGCYGQRQDTIYQTLTTASQVAGPRLLGPVTNIGQSFHQAQLKITPLNGSCTYGKAPTNPAGASNIGYGPAINFVGSFIPGLSITANYPFDLDFAPGKVYSNLVFGNTTLRVISNQSVGAYPYVYVLIDFIDTTNCTYTVSYAGTINPISPIDPSATTDYFATIAAATTTHAVPAITTVGRYVVYSVIVTNTTGTQDVTIQCINNDMTIRQDKIFLPNMQDGQTFTLNPTFVNSQSSTVNWLTCRSIDGIDIVTSKATPVYVKIGYRLE